MKRYIALITATVMAISAMATRPLLVGHRGSLYGVENSVESFTNGAKMGYDFLETDIRVTRDTVFVCSHDEDIARLTPDSIPLKVADATLAELLEYPLRQTRGDSTYTAPHITTMQEYLDICREYGVRPLIELKWGTGVNSNDCSNIPLLIDFIDRNGMLDKCIILTSMKPCLEFIRTNYPDVELQFLTGKYWPNHFDWCVDWKLDADIQATYFDKETVDKFHANGLKVNMWTINTPEGYQQYTDYGCDFITTDRFVPAEQ